MGASRNFELRPDPYDTTQRKYLRICLFVDVENTNELRELIGSGTFDVSFVRAELILEPFVLLAAANRAIYQAAHNKIYTRSLSAELIYSLSPNRNISESLETFGIAENSRTLLVCIFDDVNGKKLLETAKYIKGIPVNLDKLAGISDKSLIKEVYQLPERELNDGTSLADLVVSRIVCKDLIA